MQRLKQLLHSFVDSSLCYISEIYSNQSHLATVAVSERELNPTAIMQAFTQLGNWRHDAEMAFLINSV